MNAIAQSTTALISTSYSIDNYDFNAAVADYAKMAGKIKGNVKDVQTLKRQKMISGVCARFRDTFPSLFAKRDERGNIIEQSQRVPEEYFNKVVDAVDQYINKMIGTLCKDTMTYERKHVHRSQRQIFAEVRIIKDEQELSWPEQYTACRIAQGNVRRRKENLERDGKLLPETLDTLRKQMRTLRTTMDNIKSHLPKEELDKFNEIEKASKPVDNDF